MDATLILTGAAVGGYLLGSVPFGLVLARLAGYGDIRNFGSGNIGATNVLRTGNKPLALAVLLLDSGKGAIAVLLTRFLVPCLTDSAALDWDALAPILAGVTAVLGHNFPIWLGFKGGKGVATTLGTLIALAWPVGIAACLTWLATALIFRMSSLSALVALASAPIYAAMMPWVGGPWPTLAMAAAALAVLGWVRHHANIRRILRGEEPKIGKKTG